ncbi:MAG: AraC family transcriptional regulator [Rhizobacter sp.]
MSYRMTLTDERLYPPYKIAAVVRLLLDDGVSTEEALHGTGLDDQALDDASCLTSIEQYQQVCSSAVSLSQDPSISFRVGERLHLSDYGMYGLLLMSCESVRDYFKLAVKYQLLAAPTMAFDWAEGDGDVVWIWADETARELPQDLGIFLVEQQFVQHVTHLRDVLGASCQPTLACFAYPAPAHRDLYSQYLQCPCVFDCHRSGIQYPKETLARRPYLANPLAATMLQSTCDGLIAHIEASLGFAGKVHRTLRHLSDPGAGMKAVATALKMTDRTLRRRLADEGTSFSTIAYQVKYCVATQHLKDSQASIEQIAAIAGFSDPANFRRAFIRWTSMTPAQFRRQQHRLATM